MNRHLYRLLALTSTAAMGCGSDSLPTPGYTGMTTEQTNFITTAAKAGFELKGTLSRGGGVALDEHRIALVDRQAKQIAVVDTSGHTRFRLGKFGWEEGQLVNPLFVVQADSGVAVFDGLRTVFVRFDRRGRPRPDTPQFDAIGTASWGGFTGMAQLSDGSWVYSVAGVTEAGHQEALFHRSNGTTHLITATSPGPVAKLRYECGARMTSGSRVFWPTLRWATNGTEIVYAATGDDRVVTLDIRTGDSTIRVGDGPSRRSSEEAALAAVEAATIQTPTQRCSMPKEEVVRQRGIAERMPAIQSVNIAPNGTVWVALTTIPGEPSFIRLHGKSQTDTIIGGTFPHVFLTPTRFATEQTDATGEAVITLWDLRPVR